MSTPPPSPQRRRRRPIMVLLLVGALVAAVALTRAAIVSPVRVDSASMQPTYAAGDVVLVSRATPAADDVRRGDLVVFPSPQDGQRTLKRVVGLPGDELVILDSLLYVNHKPVAEPYVDRSMIEGYYSRTFQVPTGSVFVLGDNRGNSVDSRDYGAVPIDTLTGRVILDVWPVAR